ncbi:MAG: ABC transporter permease [Calditrichaceae bacterium]|nr:ABC transporter permease [Calditrichaceae bacterium]
MHRILYLIQKEFRQILRQRAYLGLIFIMPFLQIVVLGFAITTDVKNVPITIVDEDHSAMSRRLVDAFSVTQSFDFQGLSQSSNQAKEVMKRGLVKLILHIPPDFEKDLKNNVHPKVQAIVDGVDGNTAGIALAYVNQIAVKLQQEWYSEMGLHPEELLEVHLTEVETRMAYNAALESVNNIVPGILAVLLMAVTAFLTGMSIVREKEIGTLEQLMVTPIQNIELVLGKVVPMLVVAFLLFNVGMLGAGLIFGLWMKGNLFSLYLMLVFFCLSTLGLGIFASTIAKTQQQAMFIAWFFMVFAILLSGFFVPIENMPDFIQMITYLNPVRYFMVVIREIYLKGTEIQFLWKEGLAMLVFGLVTFISASLRFHKRLN